MLKKKKLFLLSIMVVLALLVNATACTSKENGSTESSQTQTKETTTAEKPTIKVALMDHMGFVSIKLEQAKLMQKWAEVGGVNIIVVPYEGADLETKRQTWIASKTIPDLMCNYYGNSYATVMEFGPKGVYYQVDTLFDKMPNLMSRINDYPEFNDFMTASDGHVYAFPKMNDFDYFQWGWSIRQDLLEGTNMTVDKIETTDDLYDALKIIKDKTGNAPWIARNEGSGPNRFLPMAVKMFGTGLRTYYNATTEKYAYGPFDDNFYKMVVFLNKCYKDGLIYEDIFNMEDAVFDSYLAGDKGYFFGDNMAKGQFFADLDKKYNWTMDVQKVKGPIFKVILPPKVDGKRYYGTINSGHVEYELLWTVSADTTAADNIAKILDYAYSPEGNTYQIWGEDGVDSYIDSTYNRKDYPNVEGIHRYMSVKLWPNFLTDPKEDQATSDWFDQEISPNDFFMSNFNMVFWTEEIFEYEYSPQFSDPNLQGSTGGVNALLEGRKLYNKEGVVPPQDPKPIFNKDEMDLRGEIENALDTYHDENIVKFIMGTRKLSEWNDFLNELKAMKSDDLVAIYNTANSR
jgi:putative aldouronate transport system substrate-binding protein